MKRRFDSYHRLVARLVTGAGIVGAFLILVVAGITFYDVVMRYIFEKPTTWSLDFSIYLVMWGTFLSAAYTLEQGGHISVDVVVKRLSERKRISIKIIVYILVLLFCAILTWRSSVSSIDAYRFKEVTLSYTRTPLYVPMLAIAVGGGLLVLEIFRELLEFFQSMRK